MQVLHAHLRILHKQIKLVRHAGPLGWRDGPGYLMIDTGEALGSSTSVVTSADEHVARPGSTQRLHLKKGRERPMQHR